MTCENVTPTCMTKEIIKLYNLSLSRFLNKTFLVNEFQFFFNMKFKQIKMKKQRPGSFCVENSHINYKFTLGLGSNWFPRTKVTGISEMTPATPSLLPFRWELGQDYGQRLRVFGEKAWDGKWMELKEKDEIIKKRVNSFVEEKKVF